jgi:hypothetical protein
MKIPRGGAKKKPTYSSKNRISDVAILPRHRPWLDAAKEVVTHDEIRAGAQFSHKGVKAAAVIAVIGIAHDAISARLVAAGLAALTASVLSYVGSTLFVFPRARRPWA